MCLYIGDLFFGSSQGSGSRLLSLLPVWVVLKIMGPFGYGLYGGTYVIFLDNQTGTLIVLGTTHMITRTSIRNIVLFFFFFLKF